MPQTRFANRLPERSICFGASRLPGEAGMKIWIPDCGAFHPADSLFSTGLNMRLCESFACYMGTGTLQRF